MKKDGEYLCSKVMTPFFGLVHYYLKVVCERVKIQTPWTIMKIEILQ